MSVDIEDMKKWDIAIGTLRSLSDVNLPSKADRAVADLLTVIDNLAAGEVNDDLRDRIAVQAKAWTGEIFDER